MDTSYCRLCGKIELNTELINIFIDNLLDCNGNISYIIFHCFRISIAPDDNLPKSICSNCYQQTIASFQFYEKIIETQKALKTIFNIKEYKNDEIKTETNDNDPQTKLENDHFSDDDNKDDFSDFNNAENENLFDTKNLPQFDSSLESKLVPNIFSNDATVKENDSNLKEAKFRKLKQKSRILGKSLKKKKSSEKTKSNSSDTKKSDWQKQLEVFKKKIAEEFKDYIWRCHICSSVDFKEKSELIDHFKCQHNKPAEFLCIDCSRVFKNGIQFKWHVRSHRRNVEFRCKICDKWFSKGSHYRGHMYSVHEQPHSSRVTCPKCDKSFKSMNSLKNHDFYIHQTRTEVYECDICHKRLKRKGFLKAHQKVHEEKKYICENCGVAFLTKGNLKSHIICKHSINEKDVPVETCPMCSKTFKTRVHLTRHINHTHKNKGIIHECEVCGKKLRGKTRFDQHQTLHTGELRYSCQYCQKRFRLKSTLTVHIRQHTGERPYSCVECKRDFVNTSNFRKHMKRKHNGIIKRSDPVNL